MTEKSGDDSFSASFLDFSLQTAQAGEDPIALLVKMAERGEIDPWDVDIVLIIDRFFTEAENQRSLNLRISGRLLFYAATLLRIKAEYFDDKSIDEGDDESDTGEEFFDDEESLGIIRRERRSGNPIEFLEMEISRRLERKSFRKQPVSVYMLINLLRNAEKEERRRQREPSQSFDFYLLAEDISDIAHEEAYQDAALSVLSCCHTLFEQDASVTLSKLADALDLPHHQVFISLLFLAYDGFLSLHQAEFFGEICVMLSDVMDQDSLFHE
jgi:segregation and condensation protein A